ncbi:MULTISPECIES: hypothetical protein [Methanobacterium]|uniref:Uncharacterized protein n=1 Tax=Methanobacterium veterum TaxID=408577 RepID=A0A9E4ZYF9_9EURY|nr:MULTISPECIES: hypothetical protein [Methanobacterium]MCZ3371104.1 hypothetical protein [Methanobacterium veterum]
MKARKSMIFDGLAISFPLDVLRTFEKLTQNIPKQLKSIGHLNFAQMYSKCPTNFLRDII